MTETLLVKRRKAREVSTSVSLDEGKKFRGQLEDRCNFEAFKSSPREKANRRIGGNV